LYSTVHKKNLAEIGMLGSARILAMSRMPEIAGKAAIAGTPAKVGPKATAGTPTTQERAAIAVFMFFMSS
jgi:hypothetical protein